MKLKTLMEITHDSKVPFLTLQDIADWIASQPGVVRVKLTGLIETDPITSEVINK